MCRLPQKLVFLDGMGGELRSLCGGLTQDILTFLLLGGLQSLSVLGSLQWVEGWSLKNVLSSALS